MKSLHDLNTIPQPQNLGLLRNNDIVRNDMLPQGAPAERLRCGVQEVIGKSIKVDRKGMQRFFLIVDTIKGIESST